VNPALAAALGAIAERIPPERVDAVWLFPARQLGARESGLAVLSVFAEDDERRRTRTIHTLHYVLEPPAPKTKPMRTDELEEQGTVPLDRIDRIIEGVLRRLDVPETPDVRETGGDAGKWAELLAELSGIPLNTSAPAVPADAGRMSVNVRVASEADIPAMHRIRLAVRENRLADPAMVQPDDYRPLLSTNGRGWVAEVDGAIAGFAVADLVRRNVWALFVDPEMERRGVGRRLHDEMMDWFAAQGVDRVWLSTDPGTRAEAFYRAAGWQPAGEYHGEARYEMQLPAGRGSVALDPDNQESLSLVTDSSPADPDDPRT
jgi:GNAT superfamily N-acetyltransferase